MKTVICALTHRRPVGLEHLLTELALLELPSNHAVSVCIVDNDPDESARALVEKIARDYPLPLAYVTEKTRGISAARNTGVAANADADFIAFIDDDEWPESDWLTEFVKTQAVTGADVVTGPVLPVFEVAPPAWVVRGKFFDRPRFPHNSSLNWATTSTVLISRAALDAVQGPFDMAFGVSGGSDTHYFALLHEAGFAMAWCDTGIVSETIPASRVEERWILRREYRRGQTLSRSLRARGGSMPLLVKRAARGVLEIGAGALTVPVGAVRGGKAGVLSAVRRTMFGAGILTGLADRHYDEYLAEHHGA